MTVTITPILKAHPDMVQYYWQKLAMEDQLKYRLSDLVNPTWDDVLRMISKIGNHMYMAVEEEWPVGEFALDNFTGKSAQVHFSASPEISSIDTMRITRFALLQVLAQWKDKENEPYLDSLYGLTPIHNRRACIFVLRAGMVKLGIIKSACKYMGHICDGMISVMTRETLRHG